MNWSLAFEPLLSWPLLAAMLVPLALLAAVGLWFRQRGAVLRLVALAALALALFNPVFLDEDREALKSVVAVIVDRSQSQDIGDRTAQTDAAVAGLKERLARFKQFDVRVVEAGKSGAAEERTETRLFSALDGALRDVPPSRVAGAVMITDGEVHDVPAGRPEFNAPLHALITGHENEKDRRVRFDKAPRFGLVGKPLDMTYRVIATDGQTGPVDVRVSVNGQQVAVERAFIGQEMPLQVTIPSAGRNIVELTIPKEDGELTDINNRAIALVDGIRENLRVLLVSGEPHAGERTWRNLLKSDASVDLVHFTILRPPEKQDGTPINELSLIAFPTRELFQVKIKEFDLIIFDRYANQSILPLVYFDNIVRYVREGGALLVAAGPEYAGGQTLARTPLGQILPAVPDGSVIDEAYRARVSDLGKRHPVTRDLPGSEVDPPRWGEWLRMVGAQARAGAAPVMTGPGDRPLLMLSREQKGRVALFLSDHEWLWARGFRNGGPYLDLLRRLSHWLMKEPELEEEALRATARNGIVEVERQTLGDNPSPVTITGPDGGSRQVALEAGQPGLFTARIPTDQQGLYRLTADNLTAFASVGPENPRELMDVVSDPNALQALAQSTGGSSRRIGHEGDSGVNVPRIVPVRSGSQFAGADWIGLRISDSGIVRGVQISPLFVGLIGLAILFGALVAGWLGESGRRFRREG